MNIGIAVCIVDWTPNFPKSRARWRKIKPQLFIKDKVGDSKERREEFSRLFFEFLQVLSTNNGNNQFRCGNCDSKTAARRLERHLEVKKRESHEKSGKWNLITAYTIHQRQIYWTKVRSLYEVRKKELQITCVFWKNIIHFQIWHNYMYLMFFVCNIMHKCKNLNTANYSKVWKKYMKNFITQIYFIFMLSLIQK